MTRSDGPPRYHSFLLTAWEERSKGADNPSTWRFGLEGVGNAERKRVFATLAEMVLFLREEIESLGGE
jgi:hypothetical protein